MVVPTPGESLPEPPPPLPPPPSKPAIERSLPAPPSVHPGLYQSEQLRDEGDSSSEVDLFLSAEVRKKLSMEAMPPSVEETISPPPIEAAAPRADRTRLAWMVDGFAFVVLLAAGAFIGETVARKSTLQIFGDAPASTRFPPTELLLWLGSVAACGLLYVWLGTRGWTLGARIRRR
jgi:hypothetical protein